jgi:hypothetical protein
MPTATNPPRHSARPSTGTPGNRIGKLVTATVVVVLIVAGYFYSHNGDDTSADGAGRPSTPGMAQGTGR